MGGLIAIDWTQIGFILFILLLLGILFSLFVNRFYIQLQEGGFMSLVVTAGVLITLGFAALIDLTAAIIVLICFSASGLPMIIGDIIRAIRKREKFHQSIIDATDEQIERIARKLNIHDA